MIVRRDSQISLIGAGDWPVVIKLHGDLNDPDRIAITSTHYHDNAFSPSLATWLTGTLLHTAIVFVGYALELIQRRLIVGFSVWL